MRTIKKKYIKYGVGGFDSSKPNNNIIDDMVIDVPIQPVLKINFLLELSKRNLYKIFMNDLNKFTDVETIIFNNSENIDRNSMIITKIINILKITEDIMDSIFIEAQNIINK